MQQYYILHCERVKTSAQFLFIYLYSYIQYILYKEIHLSGRPLDGGAGDSAAPDCGLCWRLLVILCPSSALLFVPLLPLPVLCCVENSPTQRISALLRPQYEWGLRGGSVRDPPTTTHTRSQTHTHILTTHVYMY